MFSLRPTMWLGPPWLLSPCCLLALIVHMSFFPFQIDSHCCVMEHHNHHRWLVLMDVMLFQHSCFNEATWACEQGRCLLCCSVGAIARASLAANVQCCTLQFSALWEPLLSEMEQKVLWFEGASCMKENPKQNSDSGCILEDFGRTFG